MRNDESFQKTLNGLERKTWNSVKLVICELLGGQKSLETLNGLERKTLNSVKLVICEFLGQKSPEYKRLDLQAMVICP